MYSSVKNEYEISFGDTTTVVQCEDDDNSRHAICPCTTWMFYEFG